MSNWAAKVQVIARPGSVPVRFANLCRTGSEPGQHCAGSIGPTWYLNWADLAGPPRSQFDEPIQSHCVINCADKVSCTESFSRQQSIRLWFRLVSISRISESSHVFRASRVGLYLLRDELGASRAGPKLSPTYANYLARLAAQFIRLT